MQVPMVAPRAFTLAVEDGWDSAHVLPKAGSQVLALCGKRPLIVWRRIWVEVARSHVDLPACVRCVAVIDMRDGVPDARNAVTAIQLARRSIDRPALVTAKRGW